MKYLASLGVLHRDLKPANVLVTDDLHCKVTDFGESRAQDSNMTTAVGTTLYLAPEIHQLSLKKIRSGTYDSKSDVYRSASLYRKTNKTQMIRRLKTMMIVMVMVIMSLKL